MLFVVLVGWGLSPSAAGPLPMPSSFIEIKASVSPGCGVGKEVGVMTDVGVGVSVRAEVGVITFDRQVPVHVPGYESVQAEFAPV